MLDRLCRLFLRCQNNTSAWIWAFTSTFILLSVRISGIFLLETATCTHWSSSKSWGGEANEALKLPFLHYISDNFHMPSLPFYSYLFIFNIDPLCMLDTYCSISIFIISLTPFLCHISLCYSWQVIFFFLFFFDIHFLEVTVFSIVNLLSHQKTSFLCCVDVPWFCTQLPPCLFLWLT
jgi:hypothetical protein